MTLGFGLFRRKLTRENFPFTRELWAAPRGVNRAGCFLFGSNLLESPR